jgi:hypothetical protein
MAASQIGGRWIPKYSRTRMLRGCSTRFRIERAGRLPGRALIVSALGGEGEAVRSERIFSADFAQVDRQCSIFEGG